MTAQSVKWLLISWTTRDWFPKQAALFLCHHIRIICLHGTVFMHKNYYTFVAIYFIKTFLLEQTINSEDCSPWPLCLRSVLSLLAVSLLLHLCSSLDLEVRSLPPIGILESPPLLFLSEGTTLLLDPGNLRDIPKQEQKDKSLQHQSLFYILRSNLIFLNTSHHRKVEHDINKQLNNQLCETESLRS